VSFYQHTYDCILVYIFGICFGYDMLGVWLLWRKKKLYFVTQIGLLLLLYCCVLLLIWYWTHILLMVSFLFEFIGFLFGCSDCLLLICLSLFWFNLIFVWVGFSLDMGWFYLVQSHLVWFWIRLFWFGLTSFGFIWICLNLFVWWVTMVLIICWFGFVRFNFIWFCLNWFV
jgi:hypothetical protein